MKNRETARRIAAAVVQDGHRLAPYRAGVTKDEVPWRSAVYVPPGFIGTQEPSAAQTECLLDGGELVHVHLRFLHLQAGTSEFAASCGDAAERELDAVWQVADLLDGERVHDTRIPGGCESIDGVTRTWEPLNVRIRASAARLPGPYGVVRLRIRVENTSEWAGSNRTEALRRSLVAAFTFLAATGGSFLSLADPPEWARPAADSCENLHTWPVLLEEDLVLSSPVVLQDRPRIVPHESDRSPGPRRGGAPRDDVPVFTTEQPWWDPGADTSVDPETDRVTIAGHEVGKGSKVRLRPAGRADAQDMFVAGRVATVEAVLSDVDGSQHLAVTIDDDPGADLRRAEGRFWYFALDDVEPL